MSRAAEGRFDRVAGLVRRRHFRGQMASAHRHASVEFNLVLRGSARYLVGDRRYDLRARTLVWLFPAQLHLMVERSAGYEDWLGLLPSDQLKRWAGTPQTGPLAEPDPPGGFARTLSPAAADRLARIFTTIADTREPAYGAGIEFAFLAAWQAFQDARFPSEAPKLSPPVAAAVRLLRGPEPPADLNSLAAEIGVSPHHLSRRFAGELGIGIASFRQSRRLERFLELHRSGAPGSLVDQAYAAGFGSSAQFYRVFRQRFGVTPADYFARAGSLRSRPD